MTSPAPQLHPDHACLIVHGKDSPGIIAAVSAMIMHFAWSAGFWRELLAPRRRQASSFTRAQVTS